MTMIDGFDKSDEVERTVTQTSWQDGIGGTKDPVEKGKYKIHYQVKYSGNLTNKNIYGQILLNAEVIDEFEITPEYSDKPYFLSGFFIKEILEPDAGSYTLKFQGRVETTQQTMTVHHQRLYVEKY